MRVILSKNAHKEYSKIPKREQVKIKRKLLEFEQNYNNGKKLTGEFSDFWSIRAWPYRVIYTVDISKEQIEVHKIRHRQKAYK